MEIKPAERDEENVYGNTAEPLSVAPF